MHLKKYVALVTLLVAVTANAAHADVFVYVVVDNQTSSAVSLNGSDTYGTFTSGPTSSVAGNTRTSVASTSTFGLYETGDVNYSSCSISWEIFLDYYTVDTDADVWGTGCTANVLLELPTSAYSALIIVELSIT